MRNFYLIKNGQLIRKQDTLYFIAKKDPNALEISCIVEDDIEEGPCELDDVSLKPEYEKKVLPVEQIDALFLYGRISLSSGAIGLLAKKQIPVHIFGYYGQYISTLYPRETLLSGDLHIRQALHYANSNERLFLAKQFVLGSASNIIKNIEYYERMGKEIYDNRVSIQERISKINSVNTVSELMAFEGNIRELYYSTFDVIMPGEFSFKERTRRPPKNPMNALISFGNSLVYGDIITALYHTQLDPTISFLHEPSERRFSLALDIAEIFKPLFVDRSIFKLVNKRMISSDDFNQNIGSCLLNENGRRIFLEEYESRLQTTIKHRSLHRKVSYKRLMYLECIKIAKHLLGLKDYDPFVIWW
ncbi:MAG TPA: type I-B CRISPR-associated endonuclease Cas1b [Methanospirillum sp.]|uniref:type I-B CRISPR-associated endonuclease Cas1b n=1 Tax=Methanospirillum sp. TaxID=45200 RepID=UPI002BBDB52B|nr:type I-B CRISPR-associated endonuclease Cas1b [Methanospirillum sp.]HOJ96565.1 type I-B CRISPR-associated endonuclease Cas1b [Methanospirillum sp.]HPP78392.1 type I-B CRISPR-associated endonuclease Cas1b [Methanospirillum sp.]